MRSHRLVNSLAILALFLSSLATSGFTIGRSPFVGVWRAIDFVDGSLMRVTILGPASGPFLITWTESYFSFCDGKAGAAAGKGTLDPSNPNLLLAHLRLKCFLTGNTVEWDQAWEYRAAYDDLLSQDTPGVVTVWKRLSQPIVPRATFTVYLPGAAEGYDWPMGHTIRLSVPDREYTAEALSEQRPGLPEGETRVLFETWRDNFFFEAGDHVFLSDEAIGLKKDVFVTNLAVSGIDPSTGTVTGTFDPAYSLWVWLNDGEGQVPVTEGDRWTATFADLPAGATGGATQGDVDGDGTSLDFQVPNPHFSAFPDWEYVEGWQWPDGTTVNALIEGEPECVTSGVSGHPEWDPNELFTSMTFPDGCDLSAGDVVTLTGAGFTRSHTVQDLAITLADASADVVSGTAAFDPALYFLHTWIHDREGSDVQPPVESGVWEVDYGALDFDIEPGMGGRAEIVDQASNATAVDWHIPVPRVIAFPAVDEVFGYGWPEGSQVTLMINGSFVQQATVAPAPWGDPNDILAYFSFADQHDLQSEEQITLAGSGMEVAYGVRSLAVTEVDAAADTVAGTADPGAEVFASIFGVGSLEQPIVATDGTWVADFGAAGFNLGDGMCGRSEIRDEVGNSTAVDWCVPDMGSGDLYAVPDENRIWANSWIEGDEIGLTIHSPDGEVTYSETRVVPPPSANPWTEVLFESGFALQPGQRIVIEQGGYGRELIVSSLRVTGFDLGARMVFGTGDPGAQFIVGINGEDVPGTVQQDGTWSLENSNLTGGAWGSAIQFDEDGDSTRDIFQAPDPNLYAVPDENRIWANAWIEDGDIVLTISNPDGGVNYTETRAVPPPSANPWTEVLFESGFTLEPGQRIVINQGGYERELIVSSLRVTGFDLGSQMIFGIGDPGAQVIVAINGVDVPGTVGQDGTWSLQNSNLTGGVWGSALQFDEDGDSTRDIFQAPEAPPPPEEHWVWAYTYDLPGGSWTVGEHTYFFEMTSSIGGLTGDPHLVTVSSETGVYEGFVLLDPWGSHARSGDACEAIESVHLDQPTRFRWGWATDEPMTYDEAVALHDSMHVWAAWDGGTAVEMVRRELLEADSIDWGAYVCGLTLAP